MWGKKINRLHYGNLKSIWGCAVMLLALLTTGVLFINYHPSVYSILSHEHRSLMIMADMTVVVGFAIALIEFKEKCELNKQKKALEQAKKVRHEYRRHIQNVQALLYIESYDEANAYALSLEEELKML